MVDEPPRIAGPVARPRAPRKRPPPGSWDTHAHIFGPSGRFPYTAGRGYTPPDAPVDRAERAALVRAAIARLPRKQRITVILRVYQELPHDEIARVLGSSVGTVKATTNHALANLRKAWPEREEA